MTAPVGKDAVAAYQQVLAQDGPEGARRAYAMLDGDLQRQLRPEEFARRWQALAPERHEQAARLRALLQKGAVREQSRVTLPDGTELRLAEHDGGAWLLLDSDVHGATPQSPEEALRYLVHAAERRDLAAVLRLLHPLERQAVEALLAERLQRLRALLAQPRELAQRLSVLGDRAKLRYDERLYIDLRQDQGAWWIQDIN